MTANDTIMIPAAEKTCASAQETIPVHWVLPDYDAIANGFGYSHHNRMMRKWSAPYLKFDESSRIALHIICADKFKPIPGKINILFTMWEFLDLPNSYLKAFDQADALIVPSSFCKHLFRQHTSKPIFTCWEGVDPNIYRPIDRKPPTASERFRFLWVGAPNPRKGYPFVLEAVKVIEKTPNVEIYMKTTVPKMNWKEFFSSIKKHWKDILFRDDEKGKKVRRAVGSIARRIPRPYFQGDLRVFGEHKNIYYDTRKLPLDELVSLYESAHCFIMPTLGEGWGLTLCEAMATGCPAIATPVTGCLDYFDDTVGYPIRYSEYEQDLRVNYGIMSRGYLPDTKDFIETMIRTMVNYDKALKRGRRASERIRSKFTWEASGKRLYEIIREVATNA